MTNTNLKALAEAVKACAHADNELPIDQIPWELALEAAALLTALAEPLGKEPARGIDDQYHYAVRLTDHYRTAYLQARAELLMLRDICGPLQVRNEELLNRNLDLQLGIKAAGETEELLRKLINAGQLTIATSEEVVGNALAEALSILRNKVAALKQEC